MYHISANLAFGRRKKYLGYKKLQGRQIGYNRAPKKVTTFIFYFVTLSVCRAPKKIAGTPDMVTLRHWVYT